MHTTHQGSLSDGAINEGRATHAGGIAYGGAVKQNITSRLPCIAKRDNVPDFLVLYAADISVDGSACQGAKSFYLVYHSLKQASL